MSDLNRVTVVGRLTRDPEVRYTSGGMPIVNLGLAVNGKKKDPTSGQWTEVPNFFDVVMFGDRFEKLASHLEKGRRIGIDGSLRWSSWETDGQKRSKVEIVADELQFLDSRGEGGGEAGGFAGGAQRGGFGSTGGDVAPDVSDFVPVGAATADDDDIPF
ncbi:MAG: single-stranded DNA-binding protein [Thermoleophilia bacterium]|nr:single-stranded DNA-binding protein [Thermoleophilia bacterium]